jgi:serine phosphatase RsbU (regulator of sigma subunit)
MGGLIDREIKGGPAGAPVNTAAEQDLLTSLRGALIGGRWALFIAELAVIGLRFNRLNASDLPTEIALGVLIVYNVAALFTLSRLSPRQVPVIGFLAADVATVGALAVLTGGITSPFTGLYYLVILMGALYYDLAGSLLVAAAAAAILITASAPHPGFWEEVARGETRTQVIPYLLLHGAVAGYLVTRLKRLHQRRIEIEEDLQRARYEERLREHEAGVAREIQRAALVSPPEHPVFQAEVRFEPARQVGGDFYAFLTDGARMGVLVGDVCGKGIPAALVSTSISHLVHWLRPMQDPAGFLSALNQNLVERLPDATFASMAFVLLEPEAETATLYNAGHPPPLLISRGSSRYVEETGIVLGVLPEMAFQPVTVPFHPGDTLVLYSDGFIEVSDAAGEQLALEGLEALARRHGALPPGALADELVAAARRYGEVEDDLTLVVIRALSVER